MESISFSILFILGVSIVGGLLGAAVLGFAAAVVLRFLLQRVRRLSITQMPGWLWGIVIIYVVGRSAGKVLGTYIAARWTGSERVVRRYLGLGLFAQGDVPIGLLDRAKVTERIDIEVFRRRQAIEFKRSGNKTDKASEKIPRG